MLTDQETEAELHFRTNTRRIENGQFMVRLPFKTDATTDGLAGSSYMLAPMRSLHLEKRLAKDPELCTDYKNVIAECIELNHMRPVKLEEKLSASGYFVPHHVVVKRKKETSKVRVGFDASAKTTTGRSLNDAMLVGPTIQSDLFDIPLQWRNHRIAINADIEKMYRMVRLHEDDAKFQKILWRDDPSHDIKQYAINGHVRECGRTISDNSLPARYGIRRPSIRSKHR